MASKSYVLDSFYLNRYVHSERDTERRLLRHFDGAVKAYQQDSYGLRLTSQMPREPKCFKKVKVFRIDGDIPVDEWIKLIALFFKGNAMIIEYFDPEQYETMFKKDLSA